MDLSFTLVAREALGAAELHGMYTIHRALYAGVDEATFRADLDEKQQIVLVLDQDRRVRGYTTLLVYEDEDGWVLFSGDTGMDRAAWGSSVLQTGWLAAAMAAHERHGPLDWLLLAGGPRTYRYLPLFFRRFWPHPTEATPPIAASRLRTLAEHRYGPRHRDGIVRLAGGLRPEHDRARDDAVDRFFRAANPGFAHGDELVCLTRIDPDNLTAAGRRVLARIRAR